MHLEYLEEFLVLSEELSYSNASKRLNITQSTLSKHISSLEADLGTALFDRSQHYVKLTNDGTSFKQTASVIVRSYRDAQAAFRHANNRDGRLFVGGYIDSPGCMALMAKTAHLMRSRDAASKSPLSFVPPGTSTIAAKLFDGKVDCAASLTDVDDFEVFGRDSLACAHICDFPFKAMVSPDHPLAQKDSLTLEDLEGQTLLHLVGPRYESGWLCIEKALRRRGIRFGTRVIQAISSFDYMGIDLEDSVFIYPEVELGKSIGFIDFGKSLGFEDPAARFPYNIVYLQGNENRLLHLFIECLTEVAETF